MISHYKGLEPSWQGRGLKGRFAGCGIGRPGVPPLRKMGNSPAFHRGRSQTGPRAHTVRPYGGKRTGRVGSGTQAQERDRPSSHFPKTQAPSGAGWNRTQALLILRAGNPLPSERGDPRKWGF